MADDANGIPFWSDDFHDVAVGGHKLLWRVVGGHDKQLSHRTGLQLLVVADIKHDDPHVI